MGEKKIILTLSVLYTLPSNFEKKFKKKDQMPFNGFRIICRMVPDRLNSPGGASMWAASWPRSAAETDSSAG